MGSTFWSNLRAEFTPSLRSRDRLKKLAGIFAGLGHLQPLLLATTNSHYLLDRFCSEEYISRIVTSLIFMEILATLLVAPTGVYIGIGKCSTPSQSGATELVSWTKDEDEWKGVLSIGIQFIITLGYFQILEAFVSGGKKGHMHWFYASLQFQYFCICLIAGSIGFWEVGRALWYLVTLPMAPIIVFFYQMIIHSWIRNNGPRNAEYIVVECQIVLVISISMMATIFWTIGYSISYTPAPLDGKDTSKDNITTGDAKIEVTVQPNTSITLTSTGSKTVPITVTATVKPGQASKYNVTITATINSETKGRIVVYKQEITGVPGKSNKITLDTSEDNTITVKAEESGQTTATVTNGTVEVKFEASVTVDLGGSDTYTYKTFYPNHGHYISLVKGPAGSQNSDTKELWNTAWDGGQCEFVEYYERKPTVSGGSGTNPALAVAYVRILGGLDTRYFGTDNTSSANGGWQIITKADFYKELDKLRGTTGFNISGQEPSETTNLVKGTHTNQLNTKYSNAFSWHTALPLLMQGLSVGAVGSIFPNLIPKTLTCPKTSRNLSVMNMFLVTIPHIFNVMLGDMDLLSRIGVGDDWTKSPCWLWPCSLLLYLIYGLAILFAIFNVHYPEWALSSFLRNNTWMVFLMILFTDVLNETFNAISRAGLFTKHILGEWPQKSQEASVDVDMTLIKEDVAQVTYLGHRTVYIQVEGARLMTDPVLAKRLMSGGIGVKRVSNKMYKYWEFPPVDIVLVSNNSYDCLDTWTLRTISDQGGSLAVGGRQISRYLNVFFKRYTYPMSWYESVNFGCVEITFLPAMSDTRRKFLSCGIDRNRMLWGGFLIRSDTRTIFYSGKTAFSEHFSDIRGYLDEKGYTIDLSILPIGPICRHGRNMSPEEAVRAHQILGSKKCLLIAHDTFPLGLEAFGELRDRLIKEASRMGTSGDFVFLKEGQTMGLDRW